MPLHHQHHAEEVADVYVVPSFAPEATEAEATENAPRYDPLAVERIIALAGQMQARHRETLSPKEIIALGQEVGVEPAFIRRALAQVEGQGALPTSHQDTSLRRKRIAPSPLTRQQWVTTAVPVVLYTLFPLLPDALNWTNLEGGRGMWAYMYLPILLAFCLGAVGKSKRVGAVVGGTLGLITIVCAFASTTTQTSSPGVYYRWHPSFAEVVQWGTWWVGSGIVLGVAGAALRELQSKLRAGKRIYLHID